LPDEYDQELLNFHRRLTTRIKCTALFLSLVSFSLADEQAKTFYCLAWLRIEGFIQLLEKDNKTVLEFQV
jgi:hypothetical protein